MGQEIVYCFKCLTRVKGAELKSANALRYGDRVACAACVPALLAVLTPQERKGLISKIQAPRPALPSTAVVRVSRSPGGPSQYRLILSGAIGGALLLIAVIVLPLGRNARRDVPSSPVAVAERQRLEAARDAFTKARHLPDSDIDAAIAAHMEALKAAEATPLYKEVEKAIQTLHERRRTWLRTELSSLNSRLGSLLERHRYKAAFEECRAARSLRPYVEWKEAIDQRLAEIEKHVEAAYQPLKQKVGEAARRGDAVGVSKLRDEVASWELPDRTMDLDAYIRSLAPVQDDVPWQVIFDGKTSDFLTETSRLHWNVQDGVLVKTGTEPARTAREFRDGQFRIRFEAREPKGRMMIYVRQQRDDGFKLELLGQDLRVDVPHEVVFTCKGMDVTATLNGKPVELESRGPNPLGHIKIHCGSWFRVLGFAYRPLIDK